MPALSRQPQLKKDGTREQPMNVTNPTKRCGSNKKNIYNTGEWKAVIDRRKVQVPMLDPVASRKPPNERISSEEKEGGRH